MVALSQEHHIAQRYKEVHTTDHRFGRILLRHRGIVLRRKSHTSGRGSCRRREGMLRVRSASGAKLYQIRGRNVGSTVISVIFVIN